MTRDEAHAMITDEMVIKALHEYVSGDHDTPEQAMRATLTAANAAAWRTVKDSLPEIGRVVLVSYNSGFSGKTVLAFGSRIDAGEGWLWGIQNGYAGGVHPDEDAWWNGVEADDEYEVTHWQPLTLPIPPQQEGE